MYERTSEGQVIDTPVTNSPRNMAGTSLSASEVRELVASRAYDLYKERGTEFGDELSDWLKAEADVVTMLLAEPQESDASENRNVRPPARTRIATSGRKAANSARTRAKSWSKRNNALKGNPA